MKPFIQAFYFFPDAKWFSLSGWVNSAITREAWQIYTGFCVRLHEECEAAQQPYVLWFMPSPDARGTFTQFHHCHVDVTSDFPFLIPFHHKAPEHIFSATSAPITRVLKCIYYISHLVLFLMLLQFWEARGL